MQGTRKNAKGPKANAGQHTGWKRAEMECDADGSKPGGAVSGPKDSPDGGMACDKDLGNRYDRKNQAEEAEKRPSKQQWREWRYITWTSVFRRKKKTEETRVWKELLQLPVVAF